MQPPFPSPTATWHNETYAAIDPSNAELSQAGKTVVITGAGSGIGRATALSFAKAGASTLVLTGRTESTLEETKKLLVEGYPKCTASVFPVSVTDEAEMHDIAKQVGKWDVLVLNAAHISAPAAIVKTSLQDWWTDYETNVKSVIIASQAFIPSAKPGAALYSITAGAALLPPTHTPGLSGYLTSKIAQSKIVEFLAAENPDLFACSVHPGMVDTGIFRGSGADPSQLPMDTRELSFEILEFFTDRSAAELCADFLVWLTQPKNKFLKGKLVWANWDVGELETRAEEIESSAMMTIGVEGWPFSPIAAK
jgi:NAD(P)-dependent dehydrogenase (short-subunit alcohol dehydrogenase family)